MIEGIQSVCADGTYLSVGAARAVQIDNIAYTFPISKIIEHSDGEVSVYVSTPKGRLRVEKYPVQSIVKLVYAHFSEA